MGQGTGKPLETVVKPGWGSRGQGSLAPPNGYGLDLTVYLAVIDDPEWMSSRLGHEVHVGAPQNIAGQMIVILDEEETCPECLGSYSEDVLCS